jgi:ferrous-iron efflux pump FieF
MDAMASVMNLLAVRYSLKSADDDHSFGHGKAEALAGLGQSCFIAGSGLILIMHAAEKITYPSPLQSVGLGISIMIVSICVTVALLAIQRSVIKRTNSTAIRADSVHYATDVLTNASTIAALFLAGLGWNYADPLFSVLIALIILRSAWIIGNDAVHLLMDQELPEELRQQILQTAREHLRVINVHDLRTRLSGQTPIIQLHLDLDADMPLNEAHAVAKEVENKLLDLFNNADIIIHQDPVSPPTQANEQ